MKPVYGDDGGYIKAKIKIYAGSMITNFQGKKMPKEKAPCECLSIIVLDSVIKANKKVLSSNTLEECKYVQEKIKIENLIDDDLEKVNQIVTLMTRQNLILIMMNMTMRQNLILIMMNMTNNLLKVLK